MDFADRIPRQIVSVDSAALLDGLLRVSQAFRLRFNEWLGQYDLNDGRHAVLSFLSTTTVFGTAADVTLAELTLECFYPADDWTREALGVRAGS